MKQYLLSRLLLLPLTLFVILLVNFAIIHLVPGDPTTLSSMGMGVVTATRGGQLTSTSDSPQQRLLGQEKNRLFRSYYGLTLPLFFNSAYFRTLEQVEQQLALAEANQQVRRKVLDEAPFLLPQLFQIISEAKLDAAHTVHQEGGEQVTKEAALEDPRRVFVYHILLYGLLEANSKIRELVDDLRTKPLQEQSLLLIQPCIPSYNFFEKSWRALVDTRLMRYLGRVITFDFGTLRSNPHETVVEAVLARLKYSFMLSIIPYISTFLLALFLGVLMACLSTGGRYARMVERVIDTSLLFLYSVPVFMVAPFLLQLVVDGYLDFPLRGFSSPDSVRMYWTTWEQLKDVVWHFILPIFSLSYSLLAAQCRLAKAAFLYVAGQEMCRFAIAKGVSRSRLWIHHIVPNGALPLITSAAGSLGIILGGSVIVELLFDLHGFGKFFYDAILERDYNVLLFSSIAGSFLTLIGYCISDLLLAVFDPRISFLQAS